MARTKIVATLGPACARKTVLREMIQAGVDVFRLNFSHGTPAAHLRQVRLVREVAAALGSDVSILGDLTGPKIRLGHLPKPVCVRSDQRVVLTVGRRPAPGELPVTFRGLAGALEAGQRLLLSDGRVEARVESVDGPRIALHIQVGGTLTSGKGINLPQTTLRESPITSRDLRCIERAVGELSLDLLALSFVQRASDVEALRDLLRERGASLPIIAKIERRQALDDLGAILEASDGLMVARGDLGVEIPFEHVPGVQKSLIREANIRAKPVITATEMLESMISAWRPTRAEATDVANAVLDGTDAVMLSAETAVGDDPTRVIEVIERIAGVTEREMGEGARSRLPSATPEDEPRAVCDAAVGIARDLRADGLLCLTMGGTTARRLACHRPRAPIFAISPNPATSRALNLVWGVTPLHMTGLVPRDPAEAFPIEVAFDRALSRLRRRGHLSAGQRIVCVAGLPIHTHGKSNLIAVREVPRG